MVQFDENYTLVQFDEHYTLAQQYYYKALRYGIILIQLTDGTNVRGSSSKYMGCEQREQAIYLLEEPHVELYDGTSKARP